MFLNADSEDSDQTGRTGHFVALSCGGSDISAKTNTYFCVIRQQILLREQTASPKTMRRSTPVLRLRVVEQLENLQTNRRKTSRMSN